MRKILIFLNLFLSQLGLKIHVSRIVTNKSKFKFLKSTSKFTKADSVAVIYLDVGVDTDDFVLNSIKSFRRFDSVTKIIVYTNQIQNKIAYLDSKLDFEIREIKDFKRFESKSDYYDLGTKNFNIISNQKWSIILSTFLLGYDWVVYTDFDIVFLDSPINYINKINKEYNFMIQSESNNSIPANLCTGFMVANRSITPMLEELEGLAIDFNDNDQVLLNRYLANETGTSNYIHVLPEALFANGLHWKNLLDPKMISNLNVYTDSIKPILFHANYLVGLENKRKMLEQLDLWLL